VAEGVETSEQYNALLGLGITKFQGFMFHRPESVKAFSSFLIQEEKSKCA
jgi:EAL domain-containing protein (putative c-di-GMP-specific phosphodiesterase class I)